MAEKMGAEPENMGEHEHDMKETEERTYTGPGKGKEHDTGGHKFHEKYRNSANVIGSEFWGQGPEAAVKD